MFLQRIFTLVCFYVAFVSGKLQRNTLVKSSTSAKIRLVSTIAGLFSGVATFPSNAFADLIPAPWSSDVQYEVLKQSAKDALQPKVGDLVAIRFRGSYKGNDFDDTFKTEQPYFYRAGVGLLLKGLDDAVVNMHVGDRYHLNFGGDLAFGTKGKASSPGKPRIPPNANVDFEVELVELPGTGDDFIADVE